ncbi:MAG: Universal stress protein family 1 [uncultured Thiotrichaceae bacterium]|uniref:Universal stress protein family 1 n=1 Tax=uncultured Thiotrichaceae bacterium TaxID=298394 RepID=A0A6S6SYB0_9GAMM|nr:MAG: Universal stress protein family 1 [uncultured Thiotrichaceae bacterium]
MKRFKNIMFFVDGKDDATPSLHRALSIAEANEARLTLVDVIKPVDTPRELKSSHNIDFTEMLKKDRKMALEKLIEGLEKHESILYSKVLIGEPFIEVIKYVQSGEYDLLIKVARPPLDFGERLFGGNDLHLLRKCPCPVLIDKPNAKRYYEHVLAAVELEPSYECSCDEQVMQLAVSLAQREDAQVDVAHAWHLDGESTFRMGRFRIPEDELELVLKSEEAIHRDRLKKLLFGFEHEVKQDNVHMLKGEPMVVINRVASSIEADIIVMGTVGRVGIPGLFIGNTAEEILQTTQSSILAVKPDGFVSPVRKA